MQGERVVAELQGPDLLLVLRKQLLRGNEFSLVLAAASLAPDALLDDLLDASYLQAMAVDEQPPYSQVEFLTLLEKGKGGVIARATIR